MKKIILLGSFAGNNAGDMVVLESIINDFNNLISNKKNVLNKSIFDGLNTHDCLNIVIPTLNQKGIDFINDVLDVNKNIVITAIPIDKNLGLITCAIIRLIKEFAKADYIYTTAGMLFDQKIWNPLYNFVVVYTPFMAWAKIVNKRVKIIGYNVGITSKSKTIGRFILKKCICLHDRIFLREKSDAMLVKELGYQGELYYSVDNVFGYNKPNLREKVSRKKIYINLTLYGVDDKSRFVREMIQFVIKVKKEHEVYFFQTSVRDLKVASDICEETGLSTDHIYGTWLMGYNKIQNILSECGIFVGMRMHSLIFALKNGCPIIAIDYATKVNNLMQDIELEQFQIQMEDISSEEILNKLGMINSQIDRASQIYENMNNRFIRCQKYK